MDNMLYIIAGLVIILLLVVLVMRKNKAQQSSVVDRKIESSQARPSPTTDRSSINQNTLNSSTTGVTKFDNVTVAQRFMDQQRYDKAIETLERGLAEKPYDSPLLLKLLDVYIATNQNDDFYRTYNTIQTHSDQLTIEQAQHLKNSMSDQHSDSVDSAVSRNMRLETETSVDTSNATIQAEQVTPATPSPIDTLDQDDFSLDFDTSYTATDESNPTTAVETINNEQDNDSFDLTLDDLEATDSGNINEPLVGGSDDKITDTQPVVLADTVSQPTANIDDDFTFDFDDIDSDNFANNTIDDTTEAQSDNLTNDQSENDTSIADNSLDTSASSPTDELSLDDDFVIDLQDFATDSSAESKADIETPSGTESSTPEPAIEDSTFSLDGSDAIDNINDDILNDDALSNIDNAFEDTLFQFDDLDADDLDTDDMALSDTAAAPINNDQSSEDDDWLIDDDLIINNFDDSVDTDPATASTPTATELSTENPDEQAPVDFDSQFSADFNFVKSLDSHQVTLDLAEQYLQLGEYDSAKRLLTEVVNQGNSEQQQKAQALLARTT